MIEGEEHHEQGTKKPDDFPVQWIVFALMIAIGVFTMYIQLAGQRYSIW